MAEEKTAPAIVVAEDATAAKAPEAKKRKAPGRQKAAAQTALPTKTPAPKATGAKTRYSWEDKVEKLKLIEARIADGAGTLKDAVKSVGISEQTYYNWKSSVKPVNATVVDPVQNGDEFAELMQLEAENQRLRKLLSERLRAENSDLRRRLGLD